MASVEAFHKMLLAAGVTPDKPLYAILTEVNGAMHEITEKIEVLKTHPVDQVARDVRRVLREEVAPEFVRRWRWDRWAKAICCALAYTLIVGSSAYLIGYWSTDNARLASWCSNRAHVVVQAGSNFCQVPIGGGAK